MRLINVRTLVIQEFVQNIPPYAILSHTWEEGEVSYEEFHKLAAKKKPGYLKISRFCHEACQQGYDYGWVDTCCIDKTSSAELSEAINSMFRWYQNAELCLAYLSDFVHDDEQTILAQLNGSRWLTRGWTLQELLAPRQVLFFGAEWELIGDRDLLASAIKASTGIDERYLLQHTSRFCCGKSSRLLRVQSATIAEKMSWAAKRKTTREEDVAYSLLGLCRVSMPLLYGEGSHAFLRLQEEIIRRHFDPTLLAWGLPWHEFRSRHLTRPSSQTTGFAKPHCAWRSAIAMLTAQEHPWSDPTPEEATWDWSSGVLANSPTNFMGSECVIAHQATFDWELTSKGLRVSLPASEDDNPHMVLPCQIRDEPWCLLAIPLSRLDNGLYGRADAPIKLVGKQTWTRWRTQSFHLSTTDLDDDFILEESQEVMWLSIAPSLELLRVVPSENWSPSKYVLYWSRSGPPGTIKLHTLFIRRINTEDVFAASVLRHTPAHSPWLLRNTSPKVAIQLVPLETFRQFIQSTEAENLLQDISGGVSYGDGVLLFTSRTKTLGRETFCLNVEESTPSRIPKYSWSWAARIFLQVAGFGEQIARISTIFLPVNMHHLSATIRNMGPLPFLCYSLVVLGVYYTAACTLLPESGFSNRPPNLGSWTCLACTDDSAFAAAISCGCVTISTTYEMLPIITYFSRTAPVPSERIGS
ncbi:uncharacterized protein JN550_001563 [Neoarthrinium moseri]|uniref:uncharacterized protein n=1 Tax=Neoarthrinium moseri TaxID=1658444 RepID=UPI001FDBBB24|nr:uncharacterized protein JN550_001563 [Neoarthrinium moseri]KAI1876067.1 hypothetical protein JN550_001563 [Neoarthrinium moseri]